MNPWTRRVLPIAAIALVGGIPLSHRLVCPLAALAHEVRSFGQNGSSGRAGRSGRDGTPGQRQTIRADGTPQQFYLVGGDGTDGEDGERGERPVCSSQPQNVRYDLRAASGGNGGNGGSGGNGGNGGSVTVYYTDLAALRQIYVDAQGGRAGRGGRGGSGSEGCRCRYSRWQLETCSGTPGTAGYSCQTERYVCQDGSNGYFGNNGRDGQPGQPGQLWLVNQEEPLLPEAPIQTQPFETFIRSGVALSKNLWEPRTGARTLLAAGSTVGDQYQEYVGRADGRAQIVWEAPRSPNQFLANSPTAEIQPSGEIAFRFPEGLWVAGERSREGSLTTFTVKGVVRASDVTRLALGQRSGSGNSLAIAVVDLAGESEYLNTQFRLTYRTAAGNPQDDRRLRYITRYEGGIPANQVTRTDNRFSIALGQFLQRNDVQPGTYVEIELTAVRSLGGNSATQSLTWRGQL